MSRNSDQHTGFVLKSTKENGPTFDILAYDKDTSMGVLRRTDGGVEFRENLAKDRLKQWGYKIIPKEGSHAG